MSDAGGSAKTDEKGDTEAAEQNTSGDVKTPEPTSETKDVGAKRAADSDQPTIVKLSKINVYTDEEASNGSLHSSDAAKALNLEADDFTSVSIKILERKLEIVQWEFYEALKAGEEKVHVDIKAKKDMLQVELPLNNITDVSLPFGGTISMACPSKALHFCSLFGLKFCVQPRTDPLASDILVAAWAAKTVSKASDCYFNKHVLSRPLLVLREKDAEGNLVNLADMKFLLLPPTSAQDAESEKLREKIARTEKDCCAAGGYVCCLAETLRILCWCVESWIHGRSDGVTSSVEHPSASMLLCSQP